MEHLIGARLGQYEIVEKIGRGGMSTVYRAYQPALDRYVAIKILPPSLAAEPGFSERFRREAQAVARLHHPNILQVYDYGIQDEYTYIVMRYVADSTTLNTLIQQQVSLDTLINYMVQVADALNYAHEQGIIHRDIKPSNILIDDKWALLTDFGLVKVSQSASLTGTGVGMGTPAFMSPEQAMGRGVDHRTDIYALGIILYKILTGTIPHEVATPLAILVKRSTESPKPLRQINPDVPENLEAVVMRALAINPEDRYATAGHFAEDLQKAASDPTHTVRLPKDLNVRESTMVGSVDKPASGLPRPQPFAKILNIGLLILTVIGLAVLVVVALDNWRVALVILGISGLIGLVTAIFFLVSSGRLTLFRKGKTKASLPPKRESIARPDEQPAESGLDERTVLSTWAPEKQPSPAAKPGKVSEQANEPVEGSLEAPLSTDDPLTFAVLPEMEGLFKKKHHLVKELLEKDIQRISASLNKEGGSRLLLTGYGSFGGTSLVRAITFNLMENFKADKAGKALVIRLDTSRYDYSQEYLLYINEDRVGFIKSREEENDIFKKVSKVLFEQEAADFLAEEGTFSGASFDYKTETAGAADRSRAIAKLVYQILNFIETSTYDDTVIREALDLLFFSISGKAKQIILILDCLDHAEAMESLLSSSITNEERYPWLSLIVVTHHEKFNRWPETLRNRQFLRRRGFGKHYIRRYWQQDFDISEALRMLLDLDLSAFNKEQRRHFRAWLAHLTYKARGSTIAVLKHLQESYWLKQQEQIVIDFIELYKRNKESIEHNAHVQKILENRWDEITGFLTRPEMVDQARVGVYFVIDWMQDHHHVFSFEDLAEAASKQPIPISDHQGTRDRVLRNLLNVLEQKYYLKYSPIQNQYRLLWGQPPPSMFERTFRNIRSFISFTPKPKMPSLPHAVPEQPPSSPPSEVEPADITPLVEENGSDQPKAPPQPIPPQPQYRPKPSMLRVALLSDVKSNHPKINALVAQIAFELLEAGHNLIFAGRPGVEVVVRQKLASYWPLYRAEFNPKSKPVMLIAADNDIKANKNELVIPVKNSVDQLKHFLEKAHIIILIQREEIADSLLTPENVEARADRQNVPVIPVGAITRGASAALWRRINQNLVDYYLDKIGSQEFAEISPAQTFVPDIAKATVKLVERMRPN